MTDPAADLREAHQRWATSPAWTLTSRSGEHEAAVRPGLQWISMFDGSLRVLILGERAYLDGFPAQATMVGPMTDPARLARVMEGRWLECDARAYLKRGRDHSAFEMFGKTFRPEPLSIITSESVDGSLIRIDGSLVSLRRDAAGDPWITGLGDDSAIELDLRYDPDEPLSLPDPGSDGAISLAKVSPRLAVRRRRPRRTGSTTIEIVSSDDGFAVSSEELPTALGVDAGLDAEALVLQLLSRKAPHLLAEIEFDSYDTVFSAYAPDQATGEELAGLIRTDLLP